MREVRVCQNILPQMRATSGSPLIVIPILLWMDKTTKHPVGMDETRFECCLIKTRALCRLCPFKVSLVSSLHEFLNFKLFRTTSLMANKRLSFVEPSTQEVSTSQTLAVTNVQLCLMAWVLGLPPGPNVLVLTIDAANSINFNTATICSTAHGNKFE